MIPETITMISNIGYAKPGRLLFLVNIDKPIAQVRKGPFMGKYYGEMILDLGNWRFATERGAVVWIEVISGVERESEPRADLEGEFAEGVEDVVLAPGIGTALAD